MSEIKKGNNKKALVVTTVASTLDQFCMNDISILQSSYNVYVAANFNYGNNTSKERVEEFKSELKRKNIVFNDICMNRNPLHKDNIAAYKEVKRLIEMNTFDIIHCHTPVAAMLVRLAARNARKNGTRIIYTAHGFHFYKGAPIKNWFLFYPVERFLARYTDVLITINQEDYERSMKSFKANKIQYIPGVGIDLNRFQQVDVSKKEKRKEIGLPEDGFVLLSVGELNKNKNHETVIRAISKLNNPNIYYVICGQGMLEGYIINLIIKLGIERQVKLLGYRKDIPEICKCSDVFVFPSFREGLSVALMEAMSSGLPVVCSDIRGNRDLVEHNIGGYTVKPSDINSFSKATINLLENEQLRLQMGSYNKTKIKRFDISIVKEKMIEIYSDTSQ